MATLKTDETIAQLDDQLVADLTQALNQQAFGALEEDARREPSIRFETLAAALEHARRLMESKSAPSFTRALQIRVLEQPQASYCGKPQQR